MASREVGQTQTETLAADGRRPGSRGLATRRKLLDHTASMLSVGAYRDLKVVDIARASGCSPATFYQYFEDVEAAVLVLAESLAEEGRALGELVRGASWRPKVGYVEAERLADAVIAFWATNAALLRVIDLATDEGDSRFADVRTRMLNELYNALTEAIQSARKTAKSNDELPAQASAGALVSMLVHVSAHRLGFEVWGVKTVDLRTSMARIVYWSITGSKPPA